MWQLRRQLRWLLLLLALAARLAVAQAPPGNVFCAANLACSVTGPWTFTTPLYLPFFGSTQCIGVNSSGQVVTVSCGSGASYPGVTSGGYGVLDVGTVPTNVAQIVAPSVTGIVQSMLPITASDITTLTTAISGLGSTAAAIVVKGPITVATNLSIPSTVQLSVEDGGSFAVGLGATLTISGPFSAGNYQVFSGSGSVVFSTNHTVNFVWFGANGSCNTSSLGSCVDSAPALSNAVAPYRVTDPLMNAQMPKFLLPVGTYLAASSINWTSLASLTVETGGGSTRIYSTAHTGSNPNVPAIDLTGAGDNYSIGPLIIQGDNTTPPGVAILGGAGNNRQGWAGNLIDTPTILGNYTLGGMLFSNVTDLRIVHPLVYASSPTGAYTYQFGIAATGHYDYASYVASAYTTPVTSSYSHDRVRIYYSSFNTSTITGTPTVATPYRAIVLHDMGRSSVEHAYFGNNGSVPVTDACVQLDNTTAGTTLSVDTFDDLWSESHALYILHLTASGLSGEPGSPNFLGLNVRNLGGNAYSGRAVFGDQYTYVSDLRMPSIGGAIGGNTAVTPTYTASSATISVPGISTWWYVLNEPVTLSSSGGSVPTGFSSGTVYYVVSPNQGASTFSLAATPGGTAIAPSDTGSGTQSIGLATDYSAIQVDQLTKAIIGFWWDTETRSYVDFFANSVTRSEISLPQALNLDRACTGTGTPYSYCTGLQTGTATTPSTVAAHDNTVWEITGYNGVAGFTVYDNPPLNLQSVNPPSCTGSQIMAGINTNGTAVCSSAAAPIGATVAAVPLTTYSGTTSSSATTIYTPSAGGMFRQCFFMMVTATGTGNFIGETSYTANGVGLSNASTTSLNTNTLNNNTGGGANGSQCSIFWSDASRPIKYYLYTSGATGPPTISYSVTLEQLQ
jgi:hypothetical protein